MAFSASSTFAHCAQAGAAASISVNVRTTRIHPSIRYWESAYTLNGHFGLKRLIRKVDFLTLHSRSRIVTSRAHVLLWTDSTAAYIDAIKAAGLAHRVVVDSLPRKEQPTAEQKARTEALMAYGAPPGLLPAMPKLRWAQSMTAGVEGWIALPDLPAGLSLTCARGTHRESMPENIIGALLYVAKPYAAAVENQKHRKWVHGTAQPLTGK